MDLKKQQFHIANLTSKRAKLVTSLEQLKNQLSALQYQQQQKSSISNPTTIYNQLQEQRASHQTNLKTIQQSINNISRQKSQLIVTLANQPTIQQQTLTVEQQIYAEELARINELITENHNKYTTTIYDEFDNKTAIANKLSILETHKNQSIANIQQLQQSAHQQRKNIIDTLKQRKQAKQDFTAAKTAVTQQRENIQNRIDEFNKANEILTAFKNTLINDIEPNSQEIQDLPQLLQLQLQQTTISTNQKITLLDTYITSNNRQIANLQKTLLQATLPQIPECLKPVQGGTITATSAYKDSYKECKAKLNDVENEFKVSMEMFDVYDDKVIGGKINEYLDEHNSLLSEIERAKQRLEIMTQRITAEGAATCELLRGKIADIDETLKDFAKQIKSSQEQILQLNREIEQQFNDIKQISELNTKIENIEKQLCQIDNDLEKLNSIS